jgi:hypothetical protein
MTEHPGPLSLLVALAGPQTRQSPGAALVDYLVTAYGLGGFEQDLTLRLNAFWAEAVAAERERIAQRVSERKIVRLSVGRDPLVEVNEIIHDIAHDIATDWEDYE